jgi:hypothetical protein
VAEDTVIRFSKENPWLAADGEVLNPEVHRIDISKQKAGPIAEMKESDWTVAVWNFPAWNLGGKHMPELAFGKPLRMPLLYDPTDPECLHNGIYYSRLADPDVNGLFIIRTKLDLISALIQRNPLFFSVATAKALTPMRLVKWSNATSRKQKSEEPAVAIFSAILALRTNEHILPVPIFSCPYN